MNEEELQAFRAAFQAAQADDDLLRRDQRLAALFAALPQDGSLVAPPESLVAQGAIPELELNRGFTPPALQQNNVPSGSAGDFAQGGGDDAPITAQDILNRTTGGANPTTSNPVVAGLPAGVSAVRRPTFDFFERAGLGSGRALALDLVTRRDEQLAALASRQQELANRAAGLESGEIEFERSQLPGRFRIATSADEFRALRDEGFLPIMAQDAEAIRRLGAEQANRIRQGADEQLDFARANRRNALVNQIAAGLGSGVGSAISRTNADVGGELGALAQQVEQVRRELGASVENRRAAFERAGEFDTRSQLDAMLAETDAFRQVQNLLVDSARQDELRRFNEISRLRQQAETTQRDIDNINANAPGFFTNLAQIQQFSNMVDPAIEFFQSDSNGSGNSETVSQQTQLRLINAANELNEVLGALESRNNLTVPDSVSEEAAARYIAQIDQIAQDLDEKGNRALLTPEVEQLLRDAVEAKGAVSGAVVRGQRRFIPGRDAEDFLENASKDPNSLLRSRIDRILSSTTGGAGTSTTTRSGNGVTTNTNLFSRGS